MNQAGYTDNKAALLKRLNRVEGQVRGVSKMMQDDKYCIDILTQVSAAKAALDRVALELLRDHAKHCLRDADMQSHGKNDKADELVSAFSRLL